MLDTCSSIPVIHKKPAPVIPGGAHKKPQTHMKKQNHKDLYKGGDSILFSAIVVAVTGLAGLLFIISAFILNLIK
jgi:hypothetical protein